MVISITNQGYIKRSPLSSLKTPKKRWKRQNRYIHTRRRFCSANIYCKYSYARAFFSTQGLAYKIKAHKIPEGTAASKGKSIFNILPLKSHHSISSIMPLPEDESEWKNMMVIFATQKETLEKIL